MKYYLISLTQTGFPSQILEEFDTESEAFSAFKEAEQTSHLRDYCSEKQMQQNEEGPGMLRQWERDKD